MDIKRKMSYKFRDFEGGLFSSVAKADVGDAVANLRAQGVDNMAWADPFYPDPSTPESVKQAVIKAVEEGSSSHYTCPGGFMDLRKTVAKKLEKYNNLKIDPSRNIIITPGSDAGLFFAMAPFIDEGDEVLTLDPGYPDNFSNVKLLGGIAISVPCYAEDNWQFRIEEFEKRLTDKTKMVLITHPSNPTGVVYRRENLEKLAEFIVKNDLVLVCDQAFEDHIFDDIEFVSPASLPGMWERTVTVFSVSKGYGLSGYRIGYLVADDHIMDVFYGCGVNILGGTNHLAELGCIAAFNDESILEGYHKTLNKRREMFMDAIKDIPHISILKPESGFLAWINVKELGGAAKVCDYLLKEAKILVNDGIIYGPNTCGKDYIRVVYGCFGNDEKASEAYLKIAKGLKELANNI